MLSEAVGARLPFKSICPGSRSPAVVVLQRHPLPWCFLECRQEKAVLSNVEEYSVSERSLRSANRRAQAQPRGRSSAADSADDAEDDTNITAMDDQADGEEIEQEVQQDPVMWRSHPADSLLMASYERGNLVQVGCYPPLQLRRRRADWGWVMENVYVTISSSPVQ